MMKKKESKRLEVILFVMLFVIASLNPLPLFGIGEQAPKSSIVSAVVIF